MSIKVSRSTLGLVAAGILCVGAGVGVGRLAPPGQLAKASAVAQLPTHGGAVNAQGITVHGWWTIKVIDHGAVVASREFENSLGADGSAALNALLASKGSINPNFGWWVQLDSSTGTRPCKATLVGSPVQQPCNPGGYCEHSDKWGTGGEAGAERICDRRPRGGFGSDRQSFDRAQSLR
jgi:hypothetical protein